MGLDLRLPIGLLLLAIGALLAGYGALSDSTIYERSLGVNVNLIWGIVLVVVGAILLVAARRKKRPAA